MNKGGASEGTSRASKAAAVAVAQKQKLLLERIDNDIGSILDDFNNLVIGGMHIDHPITNLQEALQMEERAVKMVESAEKLLKVVSELKQTTIVSGSASLNIDHLLDKITSNLNQLVENMGELVRFCKEFAAAWKELELHYRSNRQSLR